MLHLLCVVVKFLLLTACKSDIAATVTVSKHVNTLPSPWLGFGQETWQCLDALPQWRTNKSTATLKALAPFHVRIGGTSADHVYYNTTTPCDSQASGLSHAALSDLHRFDRQPPPPLNWWPSYDETMSVCQYQGLMEVAKATNVSLTFDLNELQGRNCSRNPSGLNCTGYWHTRNVYDFLSSVQQHNLLKDVNFVGWELGNELTTPHHLDPRTNVEDALKLVQMVKDIWSNSSSRPAVLGPSTDVCNNNSAHYMQATQDQLAAFSFHSYPDGNDAASYRDLLTPHWLKVNILLEDQNSDSALCIRQWNKGPRQAGMQLYVTETNSGYAPKLYTYFINGFWYMASLGQYAKTGIGMHARWSLIGRNFSLLLPNGTVSTDYFVALGFQSHMGNRVYNTSVDNDDILAYAHCNADNQVTLMLINVMKTSANITLNGYPGALHAYVYTAPGNVLHSNIVQINSQPMSINDDGTPTQARPKVFEQVVVLPQRSYAFVVTDQAVEVCSSK